MAGQCTRSYSVCAGQAHTSKREFSCFAKEQPAGMGWGRQGCSSSKEEAREDPTWLSLRLELPVDLQELI